MQLSVVSVTMPSLACIIHQSGAHLHFRTASLLCHTPKTLELSTRQIHMMNYYYMRLAEQKLECKSHT